MFDDAAVNAFLRQQGKLFDEPVADSPESAREFLEDVCAVLCDTLDDVVELLADEMDIAELTTEDIAQLEEVFPIGDGRYLVVEG